MRDSTELKGLGDLRTSITTHVRSNPAREGTEYLDLYLATNEKKRLARLTHTWEKQKRRVQARHVAVSKSMARLEEKVALEKRTDAALPPDPSAGESQAPASDYARRQWKTMDVEY